YWSPNELTAPTSCFVSSTCLGFSEAQASTEALTIPTGQHDTRRCAEGYTGITCADCVPGRYKVGRVCTECASVDNSAELVLLVIVASVFAFLICVYIALAKSSTLASAVGMMLTFQQMVHVGKTTVSKHVHNNALLGFVNFVSLMNFDIEYFKPGCSMP